MRHLSRATCQRAAVVLVLLTGAQSVGIASDKASKAKESEAKRLLGLGKAAEKQGHLLDARAQYLASEHVLFTNDAEKALERIAESADQQVKTLMDNAARAYAAEQFA